MKYKLIELMIAILFIFNSANGQNAGSLKNETLDTSKNVKDSFVHIDKIPEFPGGSDAVFNYLQKSIKYPKDAILHKAQGLVYISALIETDGSLTNIKVKKDEVGYTCADQALSAISSMPLWKPAEVAGKPVRSYIIIPVKFTLP